MPDVQARIKGLGGEIAAMGIEQFAEMNNAANTSASAS